MLLPFTRPQFLTDAGAVAAGYRLFFYENGTFGSTNVKQNTTDGDGGSTNPNPITLDSAGRPDNSGTPIDIFLQSGLNYTIVMAPPGSDDPPGTVTWQVDNVSNLSALTEYPISYAATRVTSTQFKISGQDVTSVFTVGRKIKLTGGADIYAVVQAATFSIDTTIDVEEATDSTGVAATLNASMDAAYPNILDYGTKTRKTKFNQTSLTATKTFRNRDYHQSRPIMLDLDYGATLDGTTDITTELQAAIDDLGVSGGKIIIPGSFTAGAITFPSLTNWLEISWYGTWTTTATIPVPNRVCLNGQGGYTSAQFGPKGPVSAIVESGSVSPIIEVTGSIGHSLKNFYLPSITGTGIKANGFSSLGALLWMDNVHVTCANVSTAEIPFHNESFFWIWAKGCTFVPSANSGPSIKITQTTGRAAGSYPGLMYFDDVVINSQGIHMECTQASASVSSEFHFRNMTYENCTEDLLIVDTSTTNNVIANVTFDNIVIADSGAGFTAYISYTGNYGNLRAVKFSNTILTNEPIVEGTEILGLKFDTLRTLDYTNGWGSGQDMFAAILYNQFFGENVDRGNDFSPCILPQPTLNYPEDITTWTSSGTITATSGKPAPDGTLTAIRLSSAAGTAYKYYDVNESLAVDDWILFGYWHRPATTGQIIGVGSRIDMASPSGQTFSMTANSLLYSTLRNRAAPYQQDAPWRPIVTADKVTAIGAQPTLLRFYLHAIAGADVDYWKPWVMHIPATLGLSDHDILQLQKQLTNLPTNSDSQGDVVALHNHHRLQLGGGARIFSGTAAPTTGTWKKGDIVFNTAVTAGGKVGWVCTTAGSPGTWKTFGIVAV